MNTLKQEWIKLVNKILYDIDSKIVEDYIELIDEKIEYEMTNAYKDVLCPDDIKKYQEMRKVFFSEEENIFGHNYKNAIKTPCLQIEDVVEAMVRLLNENQFTRKAVLTFTPYAEKKIPCITSIQFLVRENKLNIVYQARGQDIYNKFLLDNLCISEYGVLIADKLGISPGFVIGHIASAHIYLQDVSEAKKTINNNYKTTILTGNIKKYNKYLDFLLDNDVDILISDTKLSEVQSADRKVVVENKALNAFNHYGRPIWVDDVSLDTEAIPGFPGTYLKDMFRILSVEDWKNLFKGKVLNASMICTLCCFNGKEYCHIEGRTCGVLDFERPIIDQNMPLDSIFISFEKETHREKALKLLVEMNKNIY